MISQAQNLQAFVTNHLGGLIDWRKEVSPDPERKMAGVADPAFIVITTPYNRYKMAMATAYAEPPAGAPVACKALGWISFDDPGDNKHIVSPKSDATYMEIAKHIHVRELTDGLAVARRQLAEASAETAGAARVKLAGIAERAAKWGIAAKVPDGPAMAPQPAAQEPAAAQPGSAAEPGSAAPVANLPQEVKPPSAPVQLGGEAWVGAPLIFITNPGEQISGMQEVPGHCVKVYPDGRISAFVTADNSEIQYRDNMYRRGSPAGNGRVHQFNCWDFNPVYEAARKRADEDHRRLGELALVMEDVVAQNRRLAEDNGRLAERVAAIEAAQPAAGEPAPVGAATAKAGKRT